MNTTATATATARYAETLAAFRAGKITRAAWDAFCMEVLAETLDKCADVLQRLKNR
jgi:hypothetical protein